ncbi:dethiobiotin synthase [Aquirufa sp. OSTEICH-129V]|uniref:ATP-dependent dethiobiotin synthetase BioD n=1 Tax=Aquirufa avitistagni TaxID=3104728 RepID=A0ABW6DHU1_9BACT
MQFFITGIGTEIGKTLVSAIVTEYLQADYWKPVQSGDLHWTDTMKVQSLISNTKSVFHPERHRLNAPLSPHASAALDGVQIKLSDFTLPQTSNHLVVEGAGGLMVPLNENDVLLDLIQQLQIPVILVSRNYLGSINHTLLSFEALKHRNIPIAGIVFNGEPNPASESFIENYTQLPVLFRVGNLEEITPESIRDVVKQLPIDFPVR